MLEIPDIFLGRTIDAGPEPRYEENLRVASPSLGLLSPLGYNLYVYIPIDYFFPTLLIKIDMSQTREHSTRTAQSWPVGCSRRVHKIVYLAVKRVILVLYLVSY